jgi:alkanesulfonate monooxygenase SsuD/methylene tetrahydromethanopterin reductase-like flavin-dependent oxidoreductase (luciferase family)
MRFGVLFGMQLPKPWGPDDEHQLVRNAVEQVEWADTLGFDNVWAVEHHFLDEYSHCSASDVFLSACAARTRRIRIGFGIRQVIANYNHPSRTAETVAMLDLISNGRVELGIGEGATRLELGGYGIPAKEKRAMALEAAEQIANMMVMDPYPGYEGKSFSMPCRNVLPKPLQKPHPPLWMACTNRDTIKVAASHGLGVLAFSFVDPKEARLWSDIYYDTLKSEACVPLGHAVNANFAMVSAFSLHADRMEAIRRNQANFEFHAFAMGALVTKDNVPGRTQLWLDFQARQAEREKQRSDGLGPRADTIEDVFEHAPGIGTPDDLRTHLRDMEASGVDQVIFLQQTGMAKQEHIRESMNLFASEVMEEFRANRDAKEARRAEELAPYIEAALKRKAYMTPLTDAEIPPVLASVKVVLTATAAAVADAEKTP